MRLGTVTRLEEIIQADIDELKAMQDSLNTLKRRFERLKAAVEVKEATLIAKMERGARISCQVQISLKVSERRYPAWKDAFLSRLGESEAAAVVAATAPTIYKTLIIRDKAAA